MPLKYPFRTAASSWITYALEQEAFLHTDGAGLVHAPSTMLHPAYCKRDAPLLLKQMPNPGDCI